MQTFFADPFYEIDILIDEAKVLRLHSIPENLLSYTYKKVESRLDGLIADYEENGIYHYFSIEGCHHGLMAKEPQEPTQKK